MTTPPVTSSADALADVDLADQIRLLSGASFWHTEEIPGAGVRSITLADGPHGVRRQPDSADHLGIGGSLPATCFPTASSLASSWDPELIADVGAALGRESRAHGVAVLLGPGLNIKRHPAGGRNFEYFSEDPLLSGRLAAAMIRGIQSEGVAACPKHYVANNNESYRMVCDAIIDERTLRQVYLRGFEIAVAEGRPWTLMSSYNLVNGTYVSESDRLLREILRNEWGFDGLIVTDWGGTNDRVAAVRATSNLEMPSSGGAHDRALLAAVESGELTRETVLEHAVTVAELSARCHAEVAARGTGTLDEVAHHRLARRAAAAGTVLLTNDGTLPLAHDADVAIIGAFADQPRFQGAGSSQVVPTRLDDARRQLADRLSGRVRFAPGYDPTTGEATAAQLRAAAELAGDADVAIVFVGLPGIAEAEGYDRDTLALPPAHDQLVTAVCAANPNTVVVLMNGAPVLLPWVERPAAVVEAYLGGQAAGSAIADVLTGDAEPGGRLAETFPASMVFPSEAHFQGGRQVQYREGLYVGYRFHDTANVAPRFAFGHGLSYTTFEWGDPAVGGSGTDLTIEVSVTNVGTRAGSDVVQCYASYRESALYRPTKELVGFAKLHLEPGETGMASITLDERSFAFFDVDESRWRVEAGEVDIIIGASAVDERGRVMVQVPGDTIEASVRGAAGPTAPRFVATDAEFEAMLGHPIPAPTPILPFTVNTLVEELDATRLGRLAQRALLVAARRQTAAMLGDDPDPVVVKLSERMLMEAPLRLLTSLSGGAAPLGTMSSLSKVLNTLRLTGRRNDAAAPSHSDSPD